MSACEESDQRHVGAVCEDNPAALEVICDIVASLDHEAVPLTTLDEIKAFLASGRTPCYWLQDMQMPHTLGARPHEKVGETSVRLVRTRSIGVSRIPIIVLTAFRNDPAFLMSVARLQADDLIEKDRGREGHEGLLVRPACQRSPDEPPEERV
jgi:CheY-like chemotaxis protein